MKTFEYLEPKTVDEAVSILNKCGGKAKLIAGGTDVLVLMKQEVVTPQCLVNIKGIPGLDYINSDGGDGIKIGALTTLRAVETSSVIKEKFGVLAQAAGRVAYLQIRNVGSIAGNICQESRCWYYDQSHDWHRSWTPCYKLGGKVCYVDKRDKGCLKRILQSDLAPALIALGARVKIVGGDGEKVIPVKDFFKKVGNILKTDEILTEAQIPNQPPNTVGVYSRYSVRKSIDYPVVGVAVVMNLEEGWCRDIKIVSVAAASAPIEIDEVEALFTGKKIDSELIDKTVQVTKDKMATQAIKLGEHSADFKTNMAGVLVKRAIEACLESVKSR